MTTNPQSINNQYATLSTSVQKTVEPPIFIFGCPRSGTSLLSRLIGSHPRIAIPFESHLYNTFYPWLKYYGDLNRPSNHERLIDDILATEVMRDWTPRLSRQDILTTISSYEFHDIIDGILRAWTYSQGKQRWGEKTPAHLFYWREILAAFPNMQVLHIVRDGRDVALSWKKARFGPKHMYPLAQQWVHHLETAERLKSKLGDKSFLEVRYEQLLQAPEQTMREICTFLHEEFAPEMLAFYKTGTAYPTDRSNQNNLSRPPMVSNIGKWRLDMSAQQLNIFESVAGPTLQKYGYPRQLRQANVSNLDILRFRWLEHPPRKFLAMMQNSKGHIDGLRRLKIYARLRLGL
ncbi:MAG: sulfotransferase [Leptolyngbyaceae cyanobacterium MAG.088]|nr:sulfotransferase [Leptolyngbyaceae cyanobacterium MAG.088]